MSSKIQYLNRVDVIRENQQNIENALVSHFYKSTIIDLESFNDVECDVLKEVLIKFHLEEIEDRKSSGKTNLIKIKLIECLPEDADYVSVNMSGSRIVPISAVANVRTDSIYSQADIDKVYEERKVKINHKNNDFHSITKWI